MVGIVELNNVWVDYVVFGGWNGNIYFLYFFIVLLVYFFYVVF